MSFSNSFRHLPAFCLLAFTGSMIPPLASQAFADDKTIDTDQTTTVTTSSFLGSTGKLTITADGSITVANGAALTLDGNHTLLMQGELVANSDLSGIGLKVDTGDDLRLTAGIDIEGTINVPGPSPSGTASENVGFGLFGTGVFAGDINLSEDSVITVGGGGSKGIYIGSNLEGDLNFDGGITMSGAGSIGLHIAGDVTGDVTVDGAILSRFRDGIGVLQSGAIDGAFVHQGGINVGVAQTTDADGDIVAAKPAKAGLHLTNDISGGVLFGGVGVNDNPDDDEDVPTSAITSFGGAPALLIENLKEDGSDLVIGQVDGLDYAVVQKGSMAVTGSSAGLDAWGIKILGGEGDAWTRLSGGLHIDKGRVDVATLDADAIGIELGARTEARTILNRGTLEATSSLTQETATDGTVTYSEGGNATAVLIDAESAVTKFRNAGTIYTSAAGAGKDSFGLVDLSGTVNNISNAGTWIAARGTNNTTGDAVAIDVRANTSGVKLLNEGTITGDVWLGAGSDTVTLADGELAGDIVFGAGNDRLIIESDAIFSGGVSHQGTLDLALSGADLILGVNDQFNVTTANLSGDATLYFSIDPVQGKAGIFNATGSVVIGEDVAITPVFQTFVTEEESYELLNAGSLTLGGGLDTPILDNKSFMIDASLALNEAGDQIVLTVRPKTADELSLAGNKATIYEGLFDGIDPTDDLGSALATLESKEEVATAMEMLLPDTTNAMFQMTYSGVRQLEATLGDRLIETTARRRLSGGFWAREVVGFGSSDIADSASGTDYLGAGIMIGFDKNLSENVLWGISTGFMLQGSDRPGENGDDVSLFTPYVSSYMIASNGAAFISGSASFWYNSVTRSRGLNIGALSKSIESTSNGWTGAADAHVGYDLKLGGLHIRPKVGVSYTRAKEGGYTEEGGDGAALVIEGRTFDRFDGVGSVAIGHDFRWKGEAENAVYIRPEVFAGYRKRLGGTQRFITSARFTGGTEFFELTNDAIADTSYEMGANLNIFSGFGAASLRYTYEKREDWHAHFGGFNFKMEF
ncbi:autotransporter family protein [Kordiimonas aestuarii]|uniref:autotransporter family protein n=1 Tax=Kordiimonas aestuarii TaxID=1005925 RepID=UPI0021D36E9D|nr:autotransporter outer membrane beta-barrel domain-containing protein [Kordiimonas aestuarii]